jgi:hypothetical protein
VDLAFVDQLPRLFEPRVHLQKGLDSEGELTVEVRTLGEVESHSALGPEKHQSRPRSLARQTRQRGEALDVYRMSPTKMANDLGSI